MKYRKVKDITDIHVMYDDTPELEEYRRGLVSAQDLNEDYEIESIIRNDIGDIYYSVGGQDGIYNNTPFTRSVRDKDGIRAYAFTGSGGIAIIYKDGLFRTITLGEDDGYYYPRSRCNYEAIYGNKSDFIWAMTEAISTFNALKLD